jgi:beta-glucosidase
MGAALGMEGFSTGLDIILGPALNIHRNPLGGRCFEYFS